MVRSFLSSLVVVGLVACTKSPPAGESDAGPRGSALRVGSCDRASSVGTCSEYGSSYLAENELLVKTSCTKLGGTFVDAECPNTSVVGGCTLSSGEIRKYYGTGASAYDADRARGECVSTFHGTWR